LETVYRFLSNPDVIKGDQVRDFASEIETEEEESFDARVRREFIKQAKAATKFATLEREAAEEAEIAVKEEVEAAAQKVEAAKNSVAALGEAKAADAADAAHKVVLLLKSREAAAAKQTEAAKEVEATTKLEEANHRELVVERAQADLWDLQGNLLEKPWWEMPVTTPSGSAHKLAINNFIKVTGADKYTAQRMLRSNHWSQSDAVQEFYQSNVGSQTSSAKKALNKIFDSYRDDAANSPDNIGPNGMMKYLGAIGVQPDDIGMLIVSEIVQSPSMGEMTRAGFLEGWQNHDTVDKQRSLVLQRRGNLTVPTSLPYFRVLYRYTFLVARLPNQKAVLLDNAVEYWRLIFSPPSIEWKTESTNWLELWIRFCQEEWKKSVNRDVWNQTMEFALRSKEDEKLGFWDENAAWPGVIDDFVAWVQKERGEGGEAQGNDEDELGRERMEVD
jgi:DCN1-like protein 1/2